MHWIHWGSYERYGEGAERIRVGRYRCKRTKRTFSLLPDALLPYGQRPTATILGWLTEVFLKGSGRAAVARECGVDRRVVRRICSRFERMLGVLRLPSTEGADGPKEFLDGLSCLGQTGVADLFAGWKEFEPKLSIMGAYPR